MKLRDDAFNAPPSSPHQARLSSDDVAFLAGVGDRQLREAQDYLGFAQRPPEVAGGLYEGDRVEFVAPDGVRLAGKVTEVQGPEATVRVGDDAYMIVPLSALSPMSSVTRREAMRSTVQDAMRGGGGAGMLKESRALIPLDTSGQAFGMTLQYDRGIVPNEDDVMHYVGSKYPGARVLDADTTYPGKMSVALVFEKQADDPKLFAPEDYDAPEVVPYDIPAGVESPGIHGPLEEGTGGPKMGALIEKTGAMLQAVASANPKFDFIETSVEQDASGVVSHFALRHAGAPLFFRPKADGLALTQVMSSGVSPAHGFIVASLDGQLRVGLHGPQGETPLSRCANLRIAAPNAPYASGTGGLGIREDYSNGDANKDGDYAVHAEVDAEHIGGPGLNVAERREGVDSKTKEYYEGYDSEDTADTKAYWSQLVSDENIKRRPVAMVRRAWHDAGRGEPTPSELSWASSLVAGAGLAVAGMQHVAAMEHAAALRRQAAPPVPGRSPGGFATDPTPSLEELAQGEVPWIEEEEPIPLTQPRGGTDPNDIEPPEWGSPLPSAGPGGAGQSGPRSYPAATDLDLPEIEDEPAATEAPAEAAAPPAAAPEQSQVPAGPTSQQQLADQMRQLAPLDPRAQEQIQQLVADYLAKGGPGMQRIYNPGDPAVQQQLLPHAIQSLPLEQQQQISQGYGLGSNPKDPGEPGWFDFLNRKKNRIAPKQQQYQDVSKLREERLHQQQILKQLPMSQLPGAGQPVGAPPQPSTPSAPTPEPPPGIVNPPQPGQNQPGYTPLTGPPRGQQPQQSGDLGQQVQQLKQEVQQLKQQMSQGGGGAAGGGAWPSGQPAAMPGLPNMPPTEQPQGAPVRAAKNDPKPKPPELGPQGTYTSPTPRTYTGEDPADLYAGRRQPARGNMAMQLKDLRRRGDYAVATVVWDPERTKMMSSGNIQHNIISFVKGRSTMKDRIDLGNIGRVRVRMLDVHSGIAEVYFRSSETRALPPEVIETDKGPNHHDNLS